MHTQQITWVHADSDSIEGYANTTRYSQSTDSIGEAARNS